MRKQQLHLSAASQGGLLPLQGSMFRAPSTHRPTGRTPCLSAWKQIRYHLMDIVADVKRVGADDAALSNNVRAGQSAAPVAEPDESWSDAECKVTM